MHGVQRRNHRRIHQRDIVDEPRQCGMQPFDDDARRVQQHRRTDHRRSHGAFLHRMPVSDPAGAGAKVVCGTVIICEFPTTDATLTVTNGSPTVARAENVELSHETGVLCPETAVFNATYAVVSPTGLTVL